MKRALWLSRNLWLSFRYESAEACTCLCLSWCLLTLDAFLSPCIKQTFKHYKYLLPLSLSLNLLICQVAAALSSVCRDLDLHI